MTDRNPELEDSDLEARRTPARRADVPISVNIVIPELGYDDLILARNIELTLKAGQTTCLLGPSGVGKSSLLRTLAGLVRMPGGQQITCSDGYALEDRLSYMAQSDLLLPWATVAENLAIGFRLRGETVDMHAVRGLLKQVSLEDKENVRPAQLSGGMRQRVALARTLLENRSVVLMDEPFCALDALTRHDLQELTRRMLSHKTVLLITHDPMEALRLGDEIHVLNGSPARLYQPIALNASTPGERADKDLQQHYRDLMQALNRGDRTAGS